MESDRNNLIIGAFVLFGLAAFLTLIWALADDAGGERQERYTLIFERDVNGLTSGAPVRYLGVDVGTVSRIALSQRRRTAVRVDIDVRASTPISTATFASLAFQGVTGVAFVSLGHDRSLDDAPIRADADGLRSVSVRDTGLAALLASGGELTDKAVLLLDAANRLLDGENQDQFARTLENMATVSSALADHRDELAAVPAELQRTLVDTRAAIDELKRMMAAAGPDLVETADQLARASERLSATAVRLDGWLAENDRAVDQFLAGGLGQTPALLTETREAIRDVERLVEALRREPSRILYRDRQDAVEIAE